MTKLRNLCVFYGKENQQDIVDHKQLIFYLFLHPFQSVNLAFSVTISKSCMIFNLILQKVGKLLSLYRSMCSRVFNSFIGITSMCSSMFIFISYH